MKLDTVTEC